MTVIKPVSDLRHYNAVLEDVRPGSPVRLTVNGRGKYTIRDISEDIEFARTKAMLELMIELGRGKRSGERDGYLDIGDVRELFTAGDE